VSRDLKVQAEVYRLGLLSGYFTNDDVINWADHVIAEEDQPAIEVIDIAFGKRLTSVDLARLLEKVKGEVKEDLPFKIMLGLYSKQLKTHDTTFAEIVKSLYLMLENRVTIPDKEVEMILYFDDGFDLAVAGYYGNLQDLESELREFLNKYETFVDTLLDNSRDINGVN
jgi:hypothetical protein